MIIYALLPFLIMFVCSLIIISKTYKLSRMRLKVVLRKTKHASRNKHLYSILLTTNALFVCLVSPLVLLNSLSSVGLVTTENVSATIVYILAYSSHA